MRPGSCATVASRTIGFVMLDGKNPFFMDVARGAEDRAAEVGMAVIFGDSARDPDREGSYLDLFEQQRVHGVLIFPTGMWMSGCGG